MRERWVGALSALLGLALVYALVRVPYGWQIATLFCGISGWLVGGRMRRLRRIAEQDPLTGISNRRSFEKALRREWDHAVRTQEPLSILFLDVDDFGMVNKRYGHLMGDEALKCIVRQIRRSVRQYDFVGRWGGEEFVVLLPETDLDQASEIAERIRAIVEQSVVTGKAGNLQVTVSTGVSSVPGSACSAVDLLRQAIRGQSAAKVYKNTVRVIS